MNFDNSLFARQLRAVAASNAGAESQAERIKELIAMQRQVHTPHEADDVVVSLLKR